MRSWTLILLALVACTPIAPTDKTDDLGTDTDTSGAETDAATDDGSELDTDSVADSDTETEGPPDGLFEPPLACDYMYWSSYLVDCGADYGEMGEWMSVQTLGTEPPLECPSFFELGDQSWESAATAIAGNDCDSTCVWMLSSTPHFVFCGQSGTAMNYNPGGPGQTGSACGSLVYVSHPLFDGWVTSLEDWQAATSCSI